MQDLLEEIQELELEILDMFEVIFHFINLKKERLQDALQYYMQILESQNENTPYNAQHIIEIIKIIQTQKPEWFSNQ
ncbi:hypothetical protein CQA53_03605 [Helicobacter didelphidarum]|uniref:Uncharacterized protein n=1 Tax=Helicobacter didelphidarum TaxID=2040648 RepID=A0A3D8IN73_9HELI|nr:hypothetical protein CQA53_03605 [Helicobacter didelphidarum]